MLGALLLITFPVCVNLVLKRIFNIVSTMITLRECQSYAIIIITSTIIAFYCLLSVTDFTLATIAECISLKKFMLNNSWTLYLLWIIRIAIDVYSYYSF